MEQSHGAIFREIHKNTWLKKVTIENKKLSGIQKKVDRYWVVFCVHDDCEALLEGYIEPRQAATHTPDWSVALQSTLHVSHGLIATEQEYEFVITLSTEVLRFYASSWDIMLEWVDTLRLKLREMKILSPKENVYSKWPEIRAPLLPTRDPTSPLPAPPPVPADIIPGIERATTTGTGTGATTTHSNTSTNITVALIHSPVTTTTAVSSVPPSTVTTAETITSDSIAETSTILNDSLNTTMGNSNSNSSSSSTTTSIPNTVPITSMSNTLSQNLLNMLSNPVTSYSNHIQQNNSRNKTIDTDDTDDSDIDVDDIDINDIQSVGSDRSILSLTKTFSNNVLSESKTYPPQSSIIVSTTTSSLQPSMSTSSVVAVLTNSNKSSQDDFDEIESTSSSSSIFNNEPILIPRPQTSRSTSKEDSSKKQLNVSSSSSSLTSIPTTTVAAASTDASSNDDSGSTNITIIQLSSPLALLTTPKSPSSDIFNYPISEATTSDDNYKSNVQIIPSNNYTPDHINHYGSINNSNSSDNNFITGDNSTNNECSKVTTVQVLGDECAAAGSNHHQIKNIKSSVVQNDYGKIHKLKKCDKLEIDLTNAITNFGPVTNIPIGELNFTTPKLHYEQIFITPTVTPIPSASETNSSTPKFTFISQNTNKSITAIASTANIGTATTITTTSTTSNTAATTITSTTSTTTNTTTTTPTTATATSHTELYINRIDLNKDNNNNDSNNNCTNNIDNNNLNVNQIENNFNSSSISATNDNDRIITTSTAANATSTDTRQRSRVEHPINMQQNKKNHQHNHNTRNNRGILLVPSSPVPMIRQFLQRGLTEVSIIRSNKKETIVNSQNRGRTKQQKNLNIHECPVRRNETIEQRRRSSSTSDAHSPRNRTNNSIPNESRNANRLHPAPQPLRLEIQGGGGGNNSGGINPNLNNGSPNNHMNNNNRITLREQQVLQLRREMLHPGGVRIQLRRKDCIGSIALVDAFCGVWIAGWKQKEHPILYNALHIGDQLISVSGITVSCSTEANKIFRNTPGLYLDIIIRRVPFGRVYVVRRDMEGQCLGLIRDGNTATIIDVIPNSLSARHGLPPKAQSCDGLTLTFWVLTEINGRPLNLFFKDNEVKDRLNAMGREISILVQPLDLMTKLRKQLKSLRSHKEYIVQ